MNRILHLIYIGIIISLAGIMSGCSSIKKNAQDEKTIYVTIAPIKALVEDITCNDFEIKILVPQGASPETFELTARQIADLESARLIFRTGLIDFEQGLTDKLNNSSAIVSLNEGIETLAGSCSHAHHGGHKHGIDPHIWTSPKGLKVIAANIYTAIDQLYPDSTKYESAYTTLLSKLDSLDCYVTSRLEESGVEAFMIYHPAFTYYADDYELRQIAIEHEGKEPSPKQLAELIEAGRHNGMKHIFYQPQYSVDKVAGIAAEIGAEPVVCDPLAEDIASEIKRITDLIAE